MVLPITWNVGLWQFLQWNITAFGKQNALQLYMSTSVYLDYQAALPLPDFLATEAQALSRLGAQQLRSSEVLSHLFFSQNIG